MKIMTILLMVLTQNIYAAPNTASVLKKTSVINVDNEIKLIQQNTIANEQVFKVIEVKKNSTFKDLGYKKGDLVKSVNNEAIFNPNQLKAALDRQATEWENSVFDNDFSDGELNFNNKTFEEIEKDIEL